MIHGAAQNKGNLARVVGGHSLRGEFGTAVEPVGNGLSGTTSASRLHTRRHLQAVRLVRWGFENPTQAISYGQPRRDAPRILAIELIVIDGVAAIDELALRQGVAA